ncbi:MAG: acetyl-CoA hydrolase/transferase C-terminal domain-containing protein [Syntrophomonadaceae bacterium]|nr:acetyl-CoA hydrolase/transferase C-terminal domain-containing protein [Syntrophomonadaceae bacterium]MDD3890412.1 acetyl-CoA hydrolase/transferase C-terminal domain-containing protein [Syntrophomonadaceae bacterium]MDD4549274.1 acetyl-CoA hydrolase/transferase C-terminal domain-containing protein [Syntrophomonadaceae bacterium]
MLKHLTVQYNEKLITADEAAKLVKSGDTVFMGEFVMLPHALDAALAKRAKELENVNLRGVTLTGKLKTIEADPERQHFIYNDWHFGSMARKLHQQNLASYIPYTYHQGPRVIRKYLDHDVAFIQLGPMDTNGFFNLGPANSMTFAHCSKSKIVIVEVNTSVSHCAGGNGECMHISQIDYIVEGDNQPLQELDAITPTDIDVDIAGYLMDEIEDESCLQLGIGGLPNVVGSLIAASDLKDLGVHTEMLCDAYVDMYEAGRITGAKKNIDKYKMVYTFAMGTRKLYDFLDNNPVCASYPANYTNDPRIIGMNDKVIAINNALEVDLYSQVASESNGFRQISGTGGQLDFILGAFYSHGGKGFICISSTFTDKEGNIKSRITPTLSPGTIVTLPRSLTHYVVTEYGIAQMKGKSTWQRAEALINIAHPNFRDELIKKADTMKIWVKSNRIPE